MRKIGAIIGLLFIIGVCSIIGAICARVIDEFIGISDNEFLFIYLTMTVFMGIGPFRYVFNNIFEEFKK